MRQFVYTSLLLVIMLRFTCGERKTLSTNKKSQNILNMIAEASVKNFRSITRVFLQESSLQETEY